MKKRLFIISLIVMLMVSGIVIVDLSISSSKSNALLTIASSTETDTEATYSEKKLFERSALGDTYFEMEFDKNKGTSAAESQGRRAYPGAPPTIPHPLLSEEGIGGKSCLQCHNNGGYVDQFKAFAPVTPHPEMLNCRQCHVPTKTTGLFKESNFKKENFPNTHQSATPGSPPVIPHPIMMRENCMSCHAGAGARKDIRVSHANRVNCRQCHVPNTAKLEGVAPEFTRNPTSFTKIKSNE